MIQEDFTFLIRIPSLMLPINNPYKLFYNVYYEDTPYQTFDSTPYENKIVKVIVRKKTNPKQFEKFIDKLYATGIQDLKIVENFELLKVKILKWMKMRIHYLY